MSKSYGNTISLSERPEVMKAIVRNMVTDPARIRRTDPGNPDICPVGDYHDVFSEKSRVAEVDHGCRTAGIGCVECKMWLFESLQKRLGPFYERRRELESHPDDVMDILNEGSKKARTVASETMAEVRKAIKI
jgi:tryptophanyl-tRNA synthetase